MTSIRELKKDAKVRLSGNYLKLVLIYFIYRVVIFALSSLETFITSDILKILYVLVFLVFSVSFSFGLIYCIMDIIRGKKSSFTEFINVGFKNALQSLKVFFRMFLKLLIPIILLIASMCFMLVTLATSITTGTLSNNFILSVVLFMLAVVFLFIKSLYYSFSFYLLKDNPEKTPKEIVNMSSELMKGNILKTIGLYFSFIAWYLLIFAVGFVASYVVPQNFVNIIVEFGILLLFPYIVTTMTGFYEDILYDKTHAEETAE